MSNRHSERLENRERLGEMIEVLRRNEITKGISPEKLCAIIEELGPTFIKLGQILSMRSDFLPKAYCDALTRLRTDVQPMPYEQVVSIVESAYGQKLDEVFNRFDDQALGSASIAQVHAATLKTGEKVVVKVQREGIHDVMNRDIALMKKAVELLKYTPAKGLVDFNRVLDEMWVVAQQEMNFLTEAQNLERFSALNSDVAFVDAPKLYRQYTTATVLVMEDIEGIPIDDREALIAAGYDLAEIGAKLALLFRLHPRVNSQKRIELMAWRIERFSREETLYWLTKTTMQTYGARSVEWAKSGLRLMLAGQQKDEDEVDRLLEQLRK